MTGRLGRCWSACCGSLTARVEADDDVGQVPVGRGGGQWALQRAARPTEDLGDAKAKVNGYTERLRRKGRTDWFGVVLDLDQPTVIAPPGSTQPILGWERVYFVDGRD